MTLRNGPDRAILRAVDRGADVDVAYLEALVPAMRRLGVTAFGDVTLGPDPRAAQRDDGLSDDERMKLARKQAAEREQRLRYGASGGPRPLGHDHLR